MCVCTCTHESWQTEVTGQLADWSRFPPSTTWVMGIELKLCVMVAGDLTIPQVPT